jgi:hypothetical protein
VRPLNNKQGRVLDSIFLFTSKSEERRSLSETLSLGDVVSLQLIGWAGGVT